MQAPLAPPRAPYLAPGEVVLDVVNGEGDHLHVALAELGRQLRRPAKLCGADGCEVPRVGEEDAPSERTEQEMALGRDVILVCTADKKLYRSHCMETSAGTADLSAKWKSCPGNFSVPIARSLHETSPAHHALRNSLRLAPPLPPGSHRGCWNSPRLLMWRWTPCHGRKRGGATCTLCTPETTRARGRRCQPASHIIAEIITDLQGYSLSCIPHQRL